MMVTNMKQFLETGRLDMTWVKLPYKSYRKVAFPKMKRLRRLRWFPGGAVRGISGIGSDVEADKVRQDKVYLSESSHQNEAETYHCRKPKNLNFNLINQTTEANTMSSNSFSLASTVKVSNEVMYLTLRYCAKTFAIANLSQSLISLS